MYQGMVVGCAPITDGFAGVRGQTYEVAWVVHARSQIRTEIPHSNR